MVRGKAFIFAALLSVVPLAGAAATVAAGWDRFDATVAVAKTTMMADPTSALQKARQAGQIAETMPPSARRNEAIATGLWLQAEALTRLNKTDAAKPLLDRAIDIAARSGKLTKLDGDLALAEARLGGAQGDLALALKSFQRAHDFFAKLGELRGQARALQGLGAIYDMAHDFKREIRYYEQASQIYSSDPALELAAANNVGFAQQQLEHYDEAAVNFTSALKIAQMMKSPFLQADILTNLAFVYAKQRRFAEANRAADTALALLGSNDQSGQATFVWGVKAEIEYDRGALKVAARDLDKAFQGVDLKTTIAPFRDMHKIAYGIYESVGNYPLALAHLEAFKRLDDEGRKLTASANLALMGAQFDFATQSLEIERLKSEKLERDMSLRESRAQTEAVIFASFLAGIFVLLLWVGWRHMLVRRHRNAIAQKNVALTQTLAERDVEIGRRTETEAHLRLATRAAEDANLAKSHFLANMSHELRTPLNAIIGFSEMLAHGIVAGDKAKEYAGDINTSGQNLLMVLNDILDMARIDAGTVELAETVVDLADLVDSAVHEASRGVAMNRKSIVTDASCGGLRVRGDAKRLKQILVNLLSNAVKFTGPDGCIAVRANVGSDGVDIVVSDDGIGIPADKIDSIMEPFAQVEGAYARQHGGVGLGLPIVKSLAELHGGRFALSSTEGVGTEACVHLPADRLVARPQARSAVA